MKPQKCFYITFLLMLFNSSIYSQQSESCSVEGVLIDSSRNPIEFATATILSSVDSSFVNGALTDKTGQFIIAGLSSGEYILLLSHLVHNRKYVHVNVSGHTVLDTISLEDNVQTLDAVTITANPIQHQVDRYIVTLQGRNITKGNTANEVLGLMPGIYKQEDMLKINGRDVSDIYINDRKISDRKELEALQAEHIDKVEIIYNAGSDNSATNMGGIIKIKLKKNQVRGYYGSVSGNFVLNPSYGHTSDGVNSIINYRFSKLSIYNYLSYTDTYLRTDYEIKSLYPKLGESMSMNTLDYGWIHPFSDNLSLTYDFNDKHSLGSRFSIRSSKYSPYNTSRSSIYDSNSKLSEMSGSNTGGIVNNTQYQASLNYNWQIDNKGSTLKTVFDYLHYDNDIGTNHEYLYDIGSAPYSEFMKNNNSKKTNMLELDVAFNIQLGANSQLQFGGYYSSTKTTQRLNYLFKEDNIWEEKDSLNDHFKQSGESFASHASFVSSIGNFMYKAGLRWQKEIIGYDSYKIKEKNTRNYMGFYPSIGIGYSINQKNGTILSLSYQKALNPISYSVISPVVTYINEYNYTKGNLELKPASYDLVTLSFVLKNNWNIYYNFLKGKDIVYFTTQLDEENPLVRYTMPVNGGRIMGHVIGTDWSYKITKWWNIKVNGSLERRLYKRGVYEDLASNTESWKTTFSLDQNFSLKKGWGGSISWFLEPTSKAEERTYKGVQSLRGKVYKYFLKNKLQTRIDFTIYTVNRTLVTQKVDYWANRDYTSDRRDISFTIVYNFNGGKSVKVKQAKSILNYNEIKDN